MLQRQYRWPPSNCYDWSEWTVPRVGNYLGMQTMKKILVTTLTYMQVIVYTVKDITEVVAGPYGQPFGSLCLQVLGKNAGLAMFALNIIAQFFVGEGCTVTATRVIFAYSRDGALPLSRYWSKVDPRTKTPVIATWGVLTIAALLGLLMFASPYAIGAVFTIGKYTRPADRPII